MALGVLAKTTDPAISRVFHDLDDRGNVLAHYTTSPLKGEASQWWALSDLNGRPFGCKPNALTAELSAHTQFIVQEAATSVNASANASVSFAELSPMFTRLAERARRIHAPTLRIKLRQRGRKFSRDFGAFLALY